MITELTLLSPSGGRFDIRRDFTWVKDIKIDEDCAIVYAENGERTCYPLRRVHSWVISGEEK